MNYKLANVIGLLRPVDGYTPEEKVLETILTKLTITELYRKLPTHRMKLIVSLHYELGYPQEVVAEILGISQPTLFDEILLLKQVLLGKSYKPRKSDEDYTIEQAKQMFNIPIEEQTN